jgi:hypothetical protein
MSVVYMCSSPSEPAYAPRHGRDSRLHPDRARLQSESGSELSRLHPPRGAPGRVCEEPAPDRRARPAPLSCGRGSVD